MSAFLKVFRGHTSFEPGFPLWSLNSFHRETLAPLVARPLPGNPPRKPVRALPRSLTPGIAIATLRRISQTPLPSRLCGHLRSQRRALPFTPPAPTAPSAAAESLRTGSASGTLPPATANSTARASRAGHPSSSSVAADSTATTCRSASAAGAAATNSPGCRRSRTASLASILEPVLIIGMGAVIGALLVALYLPIFMLAQAIK
jgi:hypothetical protein